LYDGTLHKLITRLKQRNMTPDTSTSSTSSKRIKRFTTLQIIIVCEQILKGLTILHNRRIMHRDLKSTNILYDGDGYNFETMTFVITDLGESKIITKEERACTIVGTPGWIAPEVLEKRLRGDDEYYTYAADMWSFGMIIYEMMTHKYPFYNEKFVSNATADGKMPIIKQCYRDYYPTVMMLYDACTSANPVDRPTPGDALRRIQTMKETE
jgi:serine/threonine protein kinase